MRQEVRDMAKSIADELLEDFEYMTVYEIQEEYDLELTEDEAKWVLGAVSGARTTLDPVVTGQIERLQSTVCKLSNVSGIDLSELIEEGYLTEDDLG